MVEEGFPFWFTFEAEIRKEDVIKIFPKNIFKLAILLLLANILIIGAIYFRAGAEHPILPWVVLNIVGGSIAVIVIAMILNIARNR